MVGVATIIISVYCDMMIPYQFMQGGMSRAAAGSFAAVVTVIVLGIAPAMPISALFPRHSLLAAGAIGWMPLAVALSVHGLPMPTAAHPGWTAIVCQGIATWGAIAVCAWGVGRLRKDAGDARAFYLMR